MHQKAIEQEKQNILITDLAEKGKLTLRTWLLSWWEAVIHRKPIKAHWLFTFNEWVGKQRLTFLVHSLQYRIDPREGASSEIGSYQGKLNDLWLHSHWRRRGLKRDADLMIFNFHSIYRWLRPFYVNLFLLSLFACILCDPSINLNEKNIFFPSTSCPTIN